MKRLRYRLPVPVRYEDATLDNYEVRVEQHAVVKSAIASFVARAEDDYRGLLFLGPPGTGKTRALATIANEVDPKGRGIAGFLTMARYERLLRKRMTLSQMVTQRGATIETEREFAQATDLLDFIQERLPVLLLDDLGKEHTTQTAWIEGEVDYLLRRRFDVGLPTCLTSNYRKAEFAVKYSDSMESFIHEAYRIVNVRGDDIRKQR